MCGIVCAFGKIWKKEEEAFKTMLMFDTIRGPHSTGVGSVLRHNPDNVHYVKQVGTPWELFKEKDFNNMMARFHGMLLGHNRYATKGKITADNAHPFIQGDLLGVHNGTIWNQSDLDSNKEFEVDSQNIYHDMSVNGYEKTLTKINGPFALVWYDKSNHTMNAVRNEQRPLYYVFSQDKKTIFFASESWMLHVALTKNEIAFGDIQQVPVAKLHTIKMPDKQGDDVELVVTDAKFYEKPRVVYNNSTSSYNYKGNSNSATSKSGNVFNIGDAKAAKIKKLIGKEVFFSICGVRKIGNAKYILAELETNPEVQIKFFDNGDVAFWKKLIDSTAIFKGKVKSWSGHGSDFYLTIERRSILEATKEEFEALDKEQDKEGERKPDTFSAKGFEGKDLNLAQWEFATENGCNMCGTLPSRMHADFLIWTGPRSFCCVDCDAELFNQEKLI